MSTGTGTGTNVVIIVIIITVGYQSCELLFFFLKKIGLLLLLLFSFVSCLFFLVCFGIKSLLISEY